MYQLSFPILSKSKRARLTQKERLEDHDLQIVADIIYDGFREGLYTEIIPSGKRAEVIQFLRHLATRCEIRLYESSTNCFRKRVAALRVYTVEGVVVGFGVLAETISKTIENGLDLLMLGVAKVQRGLGYGAGILNSIIAIVSHHGFNLIIRCPTDSQLLYAMLVTRGFIVVKRYAQGRVMRLFTITEGSHSAQGSQISRYVE